MHLASRASRIEPFYVLEMAKAARALAAGLSPDAPPMLYLNIGEPDFTAPPLVQEAAARAIRDGLTQYTPATGLPELRERISHWYQQRFGVSVSCDRIVITAGASAALQLITLALVEPGDKVLLPDPSYPCNRHFVTAAGGDAVLVPTTASGRFQLDAASVQSAWDATTRGVMLASPSNPTGTSIDPDELRLIHEEVTHHGGFTVVDEIYLPLSFDARFGQTALATDDAIISINSFSKYFNMTGWRLGWMVVPETFVPVIERLAQNLYICPSTLAQHAALACFEAESLAIYEQRRREFQARRDYFIPALKETGLEIPVNPDGAFYAWADCTKVCHKLGVTDSWDFAQQVMEQAHIAITPGRDFGNGATRKFVRFSTASSLDSLHTAVARLRHLLT